MKMAFGGAANAVIGKVITTSLVLRGQNQSRKKTTSAQYVASRHIDPTFEKLMHKYKNLLKVISIQDLILASPSRSIPLPLLSRLSQRLHLNRGAPSFLRRYPHVFSIQLQSSPAPTYHCSLTPSASSIASLESSACSLSIPSSVHRLARLLSLSLSLTLPLRSVFRIWREFGLPDDFERSILASHPSLFSLSPNPHEPNTHLLHLLHPPSSSPFLPSIDAWRLSRPPNPDESKYDFKLGFPPGMKLSKNYRIKVKDWQRLPYVGPYDRMDGQFGDRKKSKHAVRVLEKRAVALVHEFLSLTVEKMVEVEKISHFRKWFGIAFNMRDLFLDHPGIFYLSTKGKRHTVFLREAYERGRLIESNPIYEARMKLLDLVLLGRRGLVEEQRVEECDDELLQRKDDDSWKGC